MSDDIKLDSAAAVEVAAFCWPAAAGQSWNAPLQGGPYAYLNDDEAGEMLRGFYPDDFNDLHRAAAVLVERGYGQVFDDCFLHEAENGEGAKMLGTISRVAAAPADDWARAIVATVREVKR